VPYDPLVPVPRSGAQYALVAGAARATLTGVGAGLRQLVVGDRAILFGFEHDVLAPGGAGQVLAPWPNRLEDGTYAFGSMTATVPLNEPARQNAIHGFVRWLNWDLIEQTSERVVLGCSIAPQPAYPWPVRLELAYLLRPDALEVTVRARNLGADAAPFGIGFHPYLATGAGGVDAARLSVPATVRLRANERGLPVGREEIALGAIAPGGVDATLAGVVLDDCFTGLVREADGFWHVGLQPDTGREAVVELLGDEHFPYVMCFTADTLEPSRRRRGVAIEPMSCAPNALRSGEGLVTLEPDTPFIANWGIRF
jgi:aldose 1-epimerase